MKELFKRIIVRQKEQMRFNFPVVLLVKNGVVDHDNLISDLAELRSALR